MQRLHRIQFKFMPDRQPFGLSASIAANLQAAKMNLIDLTVWSFDGFQLRSWGPSTLWSAQWSGADLCTLVDEAVRFIKLNQVSISWTKDLDANASHDIVNRLTLTSVRVTHQAGCLVVRCCLGPWFGWSLVVLLKAKALEERCTERDTSYDSPMKFEAIQRATWVYLVKLLLWSIFVPAIYPLQCRKYQKLGERAGKILWIQASWRVIKSNSYSFRISSTLDSLDHISQLASFGFGWPNLR